MQRSFERLAPYVGKALGLSDEGLAAACRPATEAEIPQILALRGAVDPQIWWDDEAFVRWRYFSRPTEAGGAPYWVFVKDGEVLAACGLEPITLAVDACLVSAVRTLDIMVRPDLDGLGLGVFMNLALFRQFPVTLVTGSNDRSHQLLTRMFHHTADLRFWKMPLRGAAVLDARLGGGLASKLASLPADVVLTGWRALSKTAALSGIVVKEMPGFDQRVTELSRRCEAHSKLMVRRSDEYLNWRFVRNPRCRYRLLAAFQGERLEGYLLARFNMARPNPRREAEIVDWLAAPRPDGLSVLPTLVQAAVEVLHEQGAGIVTCAAAADVAEPLESSGFRFRENERLPFFVRAADPALHARLSVGEDWFLTRGDIDVE